MINTEQALLNYLTTVIVDYFVPRSRLEASFQATWAFIATWSEVPPSHANTSSLVGAFFML